MLGKRLTVPFVLALTVTVAVLSSIGIHLQNSIAPETVDEPRRPSRKRLVGPLATFGQDEEERVRLFNRDLQGRCVIQSVVTMDSAGTWSVTCSSGQHLVLVYDRQGNLERVVDLKRLTLSSLPEDDPERHRLFDRHLKSHCQVISSRMESPGTWMAECGSGARFRLVFEEGYLRQYMGIPVVTRHP